MTNKGFSLIEIAISILFIAIIGLFTSQMLSYAAKTNQKVQNMDYAANRVTAVIEEYKAGVVTPRIIYYDKYWNELDGASDAARFILYAERHIDESEKTVTSFSNGEMVYADLGEFSVIHAYVIDNEIADSEKRILASVTASNYVQGDGHK